MQRVEPLADERLAAYLLRCRTVARESGQPVRARSEGINVMVLPDMTASDLADAWLLAKRLHDHQPGRA